MRKVLSVLGLIVAACGGGEDVAVDETRPFGAAGSPVAGSSGSLPAAGKSGSAGAAGSAGKASGLEVRAFSPPQPPAQTVLRGSSFVPMGWVRLHARGLPVGMPVGRVTLLSVHFFGPFDCGDIVDATLLRSFGVGGSVPHTDELLLASPPNDPYRTNRTGFSKMAASEADCRFVFDPGLLELSSESYRDLGIAVSLSPDAIAAGGMFRVSIGEIHVQLVDGTTVTLTPKLDAHDMFVGSVLVRLPIAAEPVETPIPSGDQPMPLMGWRMAYPNDLVLRGLRVRIEGLSGAELEGAVPDIQTMQLGSASGGGGGFFFGHLVGELFEPGWGVLLADATGQGTVITQGATQVSQYFVAAQRNDSVGVLIPHIDHPGDVRFLDATFGQVPLVCLSEAQPGCEGSGANAVFPTVTVTPSP